MRENKFCWTKKKTRVMLAGILLSAHTITCCNIPQNIHSYIRTDMFCGNWTTTLMLFCFCFFFSCLCKMLTTKFFLSRKKMYFFCYMKFMRVCEHVSDFFFAPHKWIFLSGRILDFSRICYFRLQVFMDLFYLFSEVVEVVPSINVF